MRKFTPANDEMYHVFNRGTEKRNIFLEKKYYERFIVNLIFFNTQQSPISHLSRYNIELACQKIPQDPLVKIHAFTLLPNHFHLILEPLTKDGVARFMHRVEMGFSHFFNKMQSRNGHLFQGAYKINHVDNDAYQFYLPLYIHLNALNLLSSERKWKEKGIKNKTNAIKFLEKYPWSSLREYLNLESMPFVARDILDELYESPKKWRRELKNWLPD